MVGRFPCIVLITGAGLKVWWGWVLIYCLSWCHLSLPAGSIDLVDLSIGIWNKDAIQFKNIFLGEQKESPLMH